MTVANPHSKVQAPKSSANEESKAAHPASGKHSTKDIKKRDQKSFLDGIKGMENSIPLIAGNFTNALAGSNNIASKEMSGGSAFAGASAQAGLNSPVAEDASAALLSNTIIQKLIRDPSLKNMAFSIQNKHGSVNVEAAINNGHMRCSLSTKSEKLRKRMHNAREQIINRLGGHMRMPVELEIEE